ncbi:unnamed protein product [Oikopleura dioica]|uniref:Sulfotransferase n=1 Tax=Oikopleura dioica TaxID=34765 RepID=E4XDG9_OIKDI|nr:unnamed protein product [Oikopleura dioica]
MINTGNIFGLFFALLVFFSYFFLELENLQIGRSGVEYGQKIVLENVDLELTKLSPEFLAAKELFLEDEFEDEVDDAEEYYDEDADISLKSSLPDATDVLSGSPEPDFEIPYEDVNDEGECKPKRHFVFHKKHKCGSTAFRFIFQAYAHKHSLIGANSMIGPFLGGYPGRFDPRFVGKRYATYDYSASHVRFDAKAFQSVFPKDTVYLTVIRSPLEHYESTFNFFYARHHTLESAMERENDLCVGGMPFAAVSGWDSSPIDYLRAAPAKWNMSIPWASRGRNFQAFELGWDVDNESQEYVDGGLLAMENDFDLVMISNYFFESLVLLKQELCMGEGIGLQIHLYVAIYNHFNKTFWQRVETYGRDKMKKDVEHLKKIYEQCAEKTIDCSHKGHEAIKKEIPEKIPRGSVEEFLM